MTGKKFAGPFEWPEEIQRQDTLAMLDDLQKCWKLASHESVFVEAAKRTQIYYPDHEICGRRKYREFVAGGELQLPNYVWCASMQQLTDEVKEELEEQRKSA